MKYKLEVEPFSHDFMRSQGGKALALKPLEEAAEAFGAWQRYEGDEWDVTDDELEIMMLNDISGELADTVQACVNLAHWYGLDLSAALSLTRARNAKRGRHEVRNGCEEGAKPDSWEQLEADAEKTSCAYFGREGNCLCSSCDHGAGYCLADQARDIVRRAKALAKAEAEAER